MEVEFDYNGQKITVLEAEPIFRSVFWEIYESTSPDHLIKVYNHAHAQENQLMAQNAMQNNDKFFNTELKSAQIIDS